MVLFSWETEGTEDPPPGFPCPAGEECRSSKPKIPSKMGAVLKGSLFGKISTMNDQKTVSLGARLKTPERRRVSPWKM